MLRAFALMIGGEFEYGPSGSDEAVMTHMMIVARGHSVIIRQPFFTIILGMMVAPRPECANSIAVGPCWYGQAAVNRPDAGSIPLATDAGEPVLSRAS